MARPQPIPIPAASPVEMPFLWSLSLWFVELAMLPELVLLATSDAAEVLEYPEVEDVTVSEEKVFVVVVAEDVADIWAEEVGVVMYAGNVF